MYIKEDNTYNEIREKSIKQWLDDMEKHEDILVRGGVKVTRDYLEELKSQVAFLEQKNAKKDKYLKQMKEQKKGEK